MKPLSLVLVARLVVAALSMTASPVLAIGFDPPTAIPLGNSSTTGAHSMASGDLNHDGRSDIVVVDWFSNVVDVLLQQPSGGFAPVVRIPSAAEAFTVALADLNQDTNLDIVVGNRAAKSVSIYLGDGTGAFAPRVDYSIPSLPSVVAVGDVTGDGKLDVVIAAEMGVCILPGNGLGQLGSVTSISTAPYLVWGIALGDLDGDGDVDIVTNYNGPFITLRQRSDGTFAKEYVGDNYQSRALALADVTGDGHPDIIATSDSQDGIYVFANDGFGNVTPGQPINTGANPWSLGIADFDVDGHLDVVTPNDVANTISVLMGTGTGLGSAANFGAGAAPISVAVLDANGDGKLDIAETDYNSGTVMLRLQNDAAVPPDTIGFTGDANWHQMPPLEAMASHAAAYDPSRQYLWLFGGYRFGNARNGGVWVYDFSSGVTASREIVVSGERPAGRNGPSLFYDGAKDRLILFGGVGYENDLWTLSLTGARTWSQWSPTGVGPTVRSLIVFDSTRDRLLVFGGDTGNDVWVLSLGSSPEWTRIVPAGSLPASRTGVSGVYDPVGDRLIIAGGQGSTVYSDTWALSLASPAWTLLSASGAAGAGFVGVLDRSRNQMIRFGGPSPCPDGLVQTVTLAPPYVWSSYTGSFPVRLSFAFDYDPVMDRVLVHGGTNNPVCGGPSFQIYDQLMALQLATMSWTTIPVPSAVHPSARIRPLMTYVPARQEAIVVGGQASYGSLSDVWRLDLSGTPVWQQLSVSGAGQPNTWGTSMIYDPVRDRMLEFGGGPYYATPTADVYVLGLQPSPTWQPTSVLGTPPLARSYHSAIYDPIGDRMIVFGGSSAGGGWPFPSGGTLYNDVWQLTLSPPMTWSQITPSGTPPPPRYEHSAIYDPVRQRMVVLGGRIGSTSSPDVWELTLGASPTWTQIFPAGSPTLGGGRDNHAVYVPTHDSVVLFDGSNTYSLSLSGVPLWSTFPNMTVVSQRSYAATLYDAGHDRMIAYAGYQSGPRCTACPIEAWDNLWTLNFAPGPASVDPGVVDRPTIALSAYPNPSATTTTLEFSVPTQRNATVRIYDVSGRLVREVFAGSLPPGLHRAGWDGRDATGDRVMPGLFFVRAQVGDVEYRRTIVRVR